MKRPARILIFDSGVGGLSILREIHRGHPNCHFFYASDNAAFPYGTKSEKELIERVDSVLRQLVNITKADIIVVACNTASTVALPYIRERFSQAIIGVVPAIKPAAAVSKSGVIGLLGTSGTVNRTYTHQLIKKHANHCEIISVGSNELVHLAEAKLRGEVITLEQLEPIIKSFKDNKYIDTIVLACTHFPHLKDELKSVLPHIIHWIDSGEAIARRVDYWLDELTLTMTNINNEMSNTAYFTQKDKTLGSLRPALNALGIFQLITLN